MGDGNHSLGKNPRPRADRARNVCRAVLGDFRSVRSLKAWIRLVVISLRWEKLGFVGGGIRCVGVSLSSSSVEGEE